MKTNNYASRVYGELCKTYPEDKEFLQSVCEVLNSLQPVINNNDIYEKNSILERIVEPERLIQFRVTWVDDFGRVQVNRAYRVQFNSALGPYKGGMRFSPTVNRSTMKFLGFEQTFKNALTGLPLGGGKGGSDFDPKEKSDGEIMRFCQSLMNELYRHIGPNTDVPAGDIGVGKREVGYLFGQYKKLQNEFTGVFTGKDVDVSGSFARTEATGYGLLYFAEEMMKSEYNEGLYGLKVVVSGSGNVAIHAIEKAQALGAIVVAASDSTGCIYDENGINLDVLREIKEIRRQRINKYIDEVDGAKFIPDSKSIWTIPCDVALPCAIQNELDQDDANILIKNGVKLVAEGANMPCTIEAINCLQKAGVLFGPAKAANAGGVATSGLEMTQNSMRLQWSFTDVDEKLQDIMREIFRTVKKTAQEYGEPNNLVLGANIAGFKKVANAMIWEGVI